MPSHERILESAADTTDATVSISATPTRVPIRHTATPSKEADAGPSAIEKAAGEAVMVEGTQPGVNDDGSSGGTVGDEKGDVGSESESSSGSGGGIGSGNGDRPNAPSDDTVVGLVSGLGKTPALMTHPADSMRTADSNHGKTKPEAPVPAVSALHSTTPRHAATPQPTLAHPCPPQTTPNDPEQPQTTPNNRTSHQMIPFKQLGPMEPLVKGATSNEDSASTSTGDSPSSSVSVSTTTTISAGTKATATASISATASTRDSEAHRTKQKLSEWNLDATMATAAADGCKAAPVLGVAAAGKKTDIGQMIAKQDRDLLYKVCMTEDSLRAQLQQRLSSKSGEASGGGGGTAEVVAGQFEVKLARRPNEDLVTISQDEKGGAAASEAPGPLDGPFSPGVLAQHCGHASCNARPSGNLMCMQVPECMCYLRSTLQMKGLNDCSAMLDAGEVS